MQEKAQENLHTQEQVNEFLDYQLGTISGTISSLCQGSPLCQGKFKTAL